MANVRLQTNKQTNRRAKNYTPLIYLCASIKICHVTANSLYQQYLESESSLKLNLEKKKKKTLKFVQGQLFKPT